MLINEWKPQHTTDASLEGKVVIITGANSGVGYETALFCARAGAHLVMVSRREEGRYLQLSEVEDAVREDAKREAIAEQKAEGVPRKLIGFVVNGRGVAREGYPIVDGDGTEIGTVTSGSQSPALGTGIGLGFVPNDAAFTAPGTELAVQVRRRTVPIVVTKPPFHTSNRS